jgi:hypothetical protein
MQGVQKTTPWKISILRDVTPCGYVHLKWLHGVMSQKRHIFKQYSFNIPCCYGNTWQTCQLHERHCFVVTIIEIGPRLNLLHYVREALVLNFEPETVCPDWGFLKSSLYQQASFWRELKKKQLQVLLLLTNRLVNKIYKFVTMVYYYNCYNSERYPSLSKLYSTQLYRQETHYVSATSPTG